MFATLEKTLKVIFTKGEQKVVLDSESCCVCLAGVISWTCPGRMCWFPIFCVMCRCRTWSVCSESANSFTALSRSTSPTAGPLTFLRFVLHSLRKRSSSCPSKILFNVFTSYDNAKLRKCAHRNISSRLQNRTI